LALRQYQELIAWQKAMDLVVRVYEVTEAFPPKELFALTNQLRRAAVSIPSNIAEGQGRQTTRDFLRYLSIARGSLQEVETQILIAFRLGYVKEPSQAQLIERISEVGRLVSGLYRSLARPESPLDH
jgi:four helix bundle protein